MSTKIIRAIDACFESTDNDPIPAAIRTAIENYAETKKRVNERLRYGFLQLTPKCNGLIQQILTIAFASDEKILTSLVGCATLKSKRNISNDCTKVIET